MTKINCPMPHCVYSIDGICELPEIDLMFGIVLQLTARNAECYLRCSQHRTAKDLEDEKSNKEEKNNL